MSTCYRFVRPVPYQDVIANLPEGIKHGIAEGKEFEYLTDGKNFLHLDKFEYLTKGKFEYLYVKHLVHDFVPVHFFLCGFTRYGTNDVSGIIMGLEEKHGVEIISEHDKGYFDSGGIEEDGRIKGDTK